MKRILIKRGTLVLVDKGVLADRDLLIEGNRIVRIDRGIQDPQAYVIDASGFLVGPGLVNMHVHFRELEGSAGGDGLLTEIRAALKGGFTTIVVMPNTNPPLDEPLVVRYLGYRCREIGLVNVYPVGAITRGLEGQKMSEIGLLKQAGAVAFSDDGKSVMDSRLLYLALMYSKYFDVPFILHEEDISVSGEGQIHEGAVAFRRGLKGIPRVAEDSLMARDLVMSYYTGAKVHFTHVSTYFAVELLRWFRNKALISADVTPHHLLLTEEAVDREGVFAKVKPPLREKRDVEALKEGIRDGVITVLASDHAPHKEKNKDMVFSEAAFGISNLEIAFPLYVKALVDEGVLDWVGLWKRMSLNPMQVLGMPEKGFLAEGAEADVTVVDPETEWEVNIENFESQGRNCPFNGWSLRGWPVYTIVGGKILMRERSILEP